ncbi:MAG: hypothetical protein DWG80_02110 [Chloroflexi bacterium]|nr:hypothetical protein [Chloroflexota bacterium]MDA1010428.1 hypothetical protein [Chloroflexota bacterium]MQC17851.1 hypothetical protein [Chloroflexota bacterium]
MSDARRPRRRRHANRPSGASDGVTDGSEQRGTPAGGDADAGENDESRPFVRMRRVDRKQRRQRQGPDLVPRPPKMRYVLVFFAGIFAGRVAEVNFAPEFLSALSLITYGALALGIAWMWRSWARRAMEQRHLQAQRRQQSGQQRGPNSPPPSDRGTPD